MWKTATFIFALGVILAPVLTDVLRSVVARQRERSHPIVSTQDIAMWGIAVSLVCLVGALVCSVFWLRQ